MEKDAFNFQKGQSVRYGGSTQPLTAKTPTRPLSGAVSGLDADAMVDKVYELLERLEQRMELLSLACAEAALAIPGVPHVQYHHEVSPKGRQIVAYVAANIGNSPELAKTIQVSMFRFYEIARTTGFRMTNRIIPDDLEAFRRQLYHLANLPASFEADKVLRMLFPPPALKEVGFKGLAAAAPEHQAKVREAEKTLVQRARGLLVQIKPKMEVVREVLDAMEHGFGHDLARFLTLEGRNAKLIALSLRAEPEISGRLRTVHGQYERLTELVQTAKPGLVDFEAFKPLVVPLGNLHEAFDRPPMLRNLFRVGVRRPVAPARPG
ncbi:MAG: hypothetical protein JWM80_4256 [Cyanobacteria bacterium RYN_339]|nr:hypothetical protein [Cyanobacteria bacterium RYN_339]